MCVEFTPESASEPLSRCATTDGKTLAGTLRNEAGNAPTEGASVGLVPCRVAHPSILPARSEPQPYLQHQDSIRRCAPLATLPAPWSFPPAPCILHPRPEAVTARQRSRSHRAPPANPLALSLLYIYLSLSLSIPLTISLSLSLYISLSNCLCLCLLLSIYHAHRVSPPLPCPSQGALQHRAPLCSRPAARPRSASTPPTSRSRSLRAPAAKPLALFLSRSLSQCFSLARALSFSLSIHLSPGRTSASCPSLFSACNAASVCVNASRNFSISYGIEDTASSTIVPIS